MGPAVAYSDACLGSLGSLEQNGAYSGGAHTGTDELCERGEHIEIMGISRVRRAAALPCSFHVFASLTRRAILRSRSFYRTTKSC